MREKIIWIILCIVLAVCAFASFGYAVAYLANKPTAQLETVSAASIQPTQAPAETNWYLQKDFKFNGKLSNGTRIIDLELGIVCYSDTYGFACLNLTPEQLSKIGDR